MSCPFIAEEDCYADCRDGRGCYKKSQLCNGVYNCKDGSDERLCQVDGKKSTFIYLETATRVNFI